MRKILYILIGILFGGALTAHAVVTNPFRTFEGGTGTTTPSGILYGDNGATTHLNTVKIGSNLNFSGGTLSVTGASTFGFPFTVNTGYNSTSTVIGFNGLFSIASSTFGSSLFLPSITQGFLYNGSNGLVSTIASSSIKLSWFNNDSAFLSSIIADSPLSGSGTSASHLVLSTAGTWSGNAGTASALTPGNTINGTTFTGASPITITAASSTALSDNNNWTKLQTFAYASTTVISSTYSSSTNYYAGDVTISHLGTSAGTFLAGDANGKIIATSTPSTTSILSHVSTTTSTGTWYASTTISGLAANKIYDVIIYIGTSTDDGVNKHTYSLQFNGADVDDIIRCESFNGGTSSCATAKDLTFYAGSIFTLNYITMTIDNLTGHYRTGNYQTVDRDTSSALHNNSTGSFRWSTTTPITSITLETLDSTFKYSSSSIDVYQK